MTSDDKYPQSMAPQRADSADTNVDNCADTDHLMPGLVQPIVDTFRRPRKHFSTRGVSRIRKVSIASVNTALFRDLYQQVDELRGMVGRKPPAQEQRPTVREFRVLSGGRSAA